MTFLGILQKHLEEGGMMKDGTMIQGRDLQRLIGLHYFSNEEWLAMMMHLQITIQSK